MLPQQTQGAPTLQTPASSIHGVGKVGSVVSDQTCLIYHRVTGALLHVHRIIRMSTATSENRPDISHQALDLARASMPDRDFGNAKTLVMATADIPTTRAFKVDVASGKIVELRAKSTILSPTPRS